MRPRYNRVNFPEKHKDWHPVSKIEKVILFLATAYLGSLILEAVGLWLK